MIDSVFMFEEAPTPPPVPGPAPVELPQDPTAPGRPAIDWRDTLTPAERRVFHHLLEGGSNKEIADAIGRSQATIKNQVASVFRKSGIHARAKLVALYK